MKYPALIREALPENPKLAHVLVEAFDEISIKVSSATGDVTKSDIHVTELRLVREIEQSRQDFSKEIGQSRQEFSKEMAQSRQEIFQEMDQSRQEFSKEMDQSRQEFSKEIELIKRDIEQLRLAGKDSEMRIQKEIEKIRLEAKDSEIRLQKEIKESELRLQKEILNVKWTVLRWMVVMLIGFFGAQTVLYLKLLNII